MADLCYYLGPWQRASDGPPGWTAPPGTRGLLDFGSLPSCGMSPDSEDHRPIGFFAIDPAESLSLDYLSLGRGDCREVKPSETLRKEVGKLLGVTPKGDTLCNWLVSLFDGGDPSGQDQWKPLVPTRAGEYEIHLGGHSRIWTAKHAIGDRRWNRTRDILRADLAEHDRECKAEAQTLKALEKSLRKAGKAADADKASARAARVENHAENVLDAICRKYGCLPTEISAEIRRGKARTSYADNFDGADNAALGKQLSWTEITIAAGGGVTWDNYSNTARFQGGVGATGAARADSDVSSADHETTADVVQHGTGAHTIAVCARFSSSANTYYRTGHYGFGGVKFVAKRVADASTTLTSSSGAASPAAIDCGADGTTISGLALSATDSAISSGTRGGLEGYAGNSTTEQWDNYLIDDGIAAGWTHKIHGLSNANIAKVHALAKTSIAKILGV